MKKIKNYWFLLSIIGLGFVFGIIFIYFINDLDKLMIKSELTEYIDRISKNKIGIFEGIGRSFLENFLLFIIVWCSGFIFLLVPITYFICFYKGFVVGFLLSALLYVYKVKGILLFVFFLFPSEIISIIFLIVLSYIIIKLSKKYFLILINKDNTDLKTLIFKYFKIFIIIILFSLIISFSEIFINYFLIKIIV